MSVSRVWEIEMVARSPISHQGETIGGTALFRRMKIIQPDGSIELVPVVLSLIHIYEPTRPIG